MDTKDDRMLHIGIGSVGRGEKRLFISPGNGSQRVSDVFSGTKGTITEEVSLNLRQVSSKSERRTWESFHDLCQI
ncbi:unnamed protein product [Bursaphelenchus xylophilus]|uniref:(pine wood nematode) hypothetical protein n=1 Tax=Bursaphelenchus xylophilus TaxID=6326 RepID=A0A7I8WT15_BURXY|nr:unnamed protein product [Bursaphelenchus xylophilus]CAG9115858.1 unnamed protein product [Bursaphelenchus xylophilus]